MSEIHLLTWLYIKIIQMTDHNVLEMEACRKYHWMTQERSAANIKGK